MGRFQVTCINQRGNHLDPHEGIEFIGHPEGGWKVSEDSAIYRIESGSDSLFTLVDGTRAESS